MLSFPKWNLDRLLACIIYYCAEYFSSDASLCCAWQVLSQWTAVLAIKHSSIWASTGPRAPCPGLGTRLGRCWRWQGWQKEQELIRKTLGLQATAWWILGPISDHLPLLNWTQTWKYTLVLHAFSLHSCSLLYRTVLLATHQMWRPRREEVDMATSPRAKTGHPRQAKTAAIATLPPTKPPQGTR